MTSSVRLAFTVGAFFFFPPIAANAQVVVPPGSEVPIPPKPKTDSAAAPKRDSIQPPFGRSFGPRPADVGPSYEWNREELFATGAYTLADLLERVPGATSFRSGWLASPKFVAMNGDLGRVRVYYDGIEVDNLDQRNGSLLDLTTLELWTLEHVQIERIANELRVHLRSWRVDRTDPYTRTDVYTGDENTNIYRGFYGKRFGSGAGLQLAGQQYSTRARRLGGGGDALSFTGRLGIARGAWSLDAFAVRRGSSRVVQPTFGSGLSIPGFDGTHSLVYLRLGVGRPAGGPWAELIASNLRFAERTPHVAGSTQVISDTTDTTTRRFQYVASAGIARGPLRVSVGDRIRAYGGDVYHAPSARLGLDSRIAGVNLYAESDRLAKASIADAVGRLTPLPFVSIVGAFSVTTPDDAMPTGAPRTVAARVEGGVRILGPWLIGGFITRDTALLVPPTVFDTVYRARYVGRRQGVYAGLRGRLYRDLNLDVVGTRWDSAGFYQPRYQARSEINLDTRWRSRFPSGTFGLKVAFLHEYRSEVDFPTVSGIRTTDVSNVISALLEIRVLRGVASYQVRNIAGLNYQIVPDFYMPRAIGIYGLRWEFWN